MYVVGLIFGAIVCIVIIITCVTSIACPKYKHIDAALHLSPRRIETGFTLDHLLSSFAFIFPHTMKQIRYDINSLM